MEDCTSIEKMIKYSTHWNIFYLYHNIVVSSRHMQWGGFVQYITTQSYHGVIEVRIAIQVYRDCSPHSNSTVAIRTAVRIETNCYTDFGPNRYILLCGLRNISMLSEPVGLLQALPVAPFRRFRLSVLRAAFAVWEITAPLNVRSPEVTKGIPITWYVSNITVWDTNEASFQLMLIPNEPHKTAAMQKSPYY